MAKRFVEVAYKCSCMTAEAIVHVPERHRADDLGEWVGETVGTIISIDHRQRSPLCQSRVMEYAKFPVPKDGGHIGEAQGGTA